MLRASSGKHAHGLSGFVLPAVTPFPRHPRTRPKIVCSLSANPPEKCSKISPKSSHKGIENPPQSGFSFTWSEVLGALGGILGSRCLPDPSRSFLDPFWGPFRLIFGSSNRDIAQGALKEGAPELV